MEGRCVRCRKQVEIKNPNITKTSKGVNMAKGNCPNCNTIVCRMLGKDKQ